MGAPPAESVFAWKYLFIAASCSSCLTLVISACTLLGHLTHFKYPRYQIHICRILLLVPLNTLVSWVSLVVGTYRPLLTTVRDCYEGFVIYAFFSLLVEYLGGERALVDWLEVHGHVRHVWPLEHRCRSIKLGRRFLRNVKQGTLQFVFVKPCTGIIALVLTKNGMYTEGSISPSDGYPYISGINNCSITVSMYSLFLFYLATAEKLQPFRPVPKFVAIKSVVFLLYWQNCAMNLILATGVSDTLLRQIQDTVVCCEMTVAALAHHYAFHYDESDDRIAPGPPDEEEDTAPLIPKVAKVLNVGEQILGDSRKVFLEKDLEPKVLEFKQVQKRDGGEEVEAWI